jgi:hypothetical protein
MKFTLSFHAARIASRAPSGSAISDHCFLPLTSDAL